MTYYIADRIIIVKGRLRSIGELTPKIRNSCRTNVPVVGRQQKNLCSCRTNVPEAGGQQKNQLPKGSMIRCGVSALFFMCGGKMDKQTAVKIITECAKEYHTYLENKNLAFVFGSPPKAEFFEASFLPRNFLHLTGVTMTNKVSGSSDFYKKALKGRLSPNDFSVCNNGTTDIKLMVLPKLVKIHSNAKMIGDYNSSKSVLYTEKLAGNITACLGFVRDGNYYIPNTALKEDIRDITAKPQQRVLAIFKKPIKQPLYNELCYIAKGVVLEEVNMPPEIASKISYGNNE